MKAKEIIEAIERKISTETQLEFDNSGLQIGPFDREVSRIMLSLDLNENVMNKAIEKNCEMMVSHHPLIFDALKKIDLNSSKGRFIEKALKNEITVYSSHTPMDINSHGMNDYICDLLSVEDTQSITDTGKDAVYKYQVFVPATHRDVVVDAISKAGGGFIGNYSDCTFSTRGTGTFRPLEGTNPYIGTFNVRESVDEYKIESVIMKEGLPNLINAVLEVHPYEEVAYEVFPLHIPNFPRGIGRIGNLRKEMTMRELLEKSSEIFGQNSIKYVGNMDGKVRSIAVCSGSGAFLMKSLIGRCDVYISGDFKYHDYQYAFENGLNIIDIDHNSSEKFFPEVFKKSFDNLDVVFHTCESVFCEIYRR